MNEGLPARTSRILLSLLLTLSLAIAGALAQSKTSSALVGRVLDEKGTALPGATVEIESPALIGGSRAVQTDAAGKFRFPEIAPGSYTITVSLAGYKKVRWEDVRLSIGQTTEVPISLYAATGDETVTVIGEASAIDTSSSAASTTLPREYLENLPTGRFQPDTLNLAPGINLDSAFGGGGSSANAWQIDGIDTSDPEAGSAWSFVNYNIIDEVQLVGLGAPAEYGGFTGVVFNSNTKSGSNTFSGLVDGYYSNDSLTSSNEATEGVNPTVQEYIDTTAQVGGPIMKDKLWYFLSAQYFKTTTNNGGPDRSEESPRGFGKATWQINPTNMFEAWVEWDRYDITGRGGDAFTPLEATVKETAPEWVWNFSWKSVLTPNTILKVALGGYTGYYYLDPTSGYDIAGHYNGATGSYEDNSTYYFLADRDRNQLNASLSQHASDFIKGDHDFKFGMEIERSTVRNRYGYPTGAKFYDNYYGDDPSIPGYDPDNPDYYTTAYIGGSYDVHARNERLSFFVQDAWEITPNFTLNPGVRLDMNRGYVEPHELVFNTNPVAARLGFAWDLTGDGKTLFKGHYGRYYEGLKGAYYYYVDPGAYEPLTIETRWTSGFVETVTKSKSYVLDPDLKHPYLDQFILGLDRELFPGFTLSGTLIYRKNKQFVETVSRDGIFKPVTGEVGVTGSDGRTASTGQTVTLYDYLNPDTDVLIVTNPSDLERTYKAVMVVGTKRLSKNWQLLASYVYSQATGTIDNVDFDLSSDSGGQNGGPSPFLDTPNSLVNADGRMTHDQQHQMKIQGTYVIPSLGLTLSGNWTLHSGDTYTRKTTCLLSNDDGDPSTNDCHDFPQGTVRYFAEERGSRRLPSRSEVDARVEWAHAFSGGLKFGLILDAFNLNNQGRATEVQDRDGSTFEDISSANTPRNLRFGARFTF